MKPALTAEEWKFPRVYFRGGLYDDANVERAVPKVGSVCATLATFGVELVSTPNTIEDPPLWVWDDSWSVLIREPVRHALAALSLYKQPFGFTREDVEHLRGGFHAHDFTSLADRIEALLPPEDA